MSMAENEIVNHSGSQGLPMGDAAFDSIMSTGLDQVAASPEPPLPADAGTPGADREKADEQSKEPAEKADVQAKAEGEAEAAAAAGAEPEGDKAPTLAYPDLSEQENKLIQALPKAEQAAMADRFNHNNFMGFFKDLTVPINTVADKLIEKSESRYVELKQEILNREFADPVKALGEIYARDPALYGKLASTALQADPAYFVKAITGRDGVDGEAIKTALDFYDANKDRIPAQVEGGVKQLSKEELDEIEKYHGEDVRKQVEALQAAATAPKQQPAKDEKTKAELKELREFKAGKERENQQAQEGQLTKQQEESKKLFEETWAAGYGNIDSYIAKKLDDVEDGYGLLVTDEMRKLSPEISELKDIKRSLVLKGAIDLPDFEVGFGEWGKPQESFKKAADVFAGYCGRKEKQNAVEASNALLPYADTYLAERMNHPLVKRIDALLADAVKRNGKAPRTQTILPGSTAAPSGNAEPANVEDYINNFGIQR